MSSFVSVARRIKNRASQESTNAVEGLDLIFGEVTERGIVTKRFKGKPIEDYKILEHLTLNTNFMTNTNSAGSQSTHTHNVITPKQLKPLSLGDIVVLSLVEGEFVVMGRIADNE